MIYFVTDPTGEYVKTLIIDEQTKWISFLREKGCIKGVDKG